MSANKGMEMEKILFEEDLKGFQIFKIGLLLASISFAICIYGAIGLSTPFSQSFLLILFLVLCLSYTTSRLLQMKRIIIKSNEIVLKNLWSTSRVIQYKDISRMEIRFAKIVIFLKDAHAGYPLPFVPPEDIKKNGTNIQRERFGNEY